jgi:hypothetical protein
VSKSWFMVVNESMWWNALEIVQINYAWYFQPLQKMPSLSFLFNKLFIFKIQCLKVCLHAIDLSEEFYNLDMQSYNDSHLGLQTRRYNKRNLSIHLEISNFNVDET